MTSIRVGGKGIDRKAFTQCDVGIGHTDQEIWLMLSHTTDQHVHVVMTPDEARGLARDLQEYATKADTEPGAEAKIPLQRIDDVHPTLAALDEAFPKGATQLELDIVGELSRLSAAKAEELWTDRPAQRQVLSNVLHGRTVSKLARAAIREAMKGRPLSDLVLVVPAVLNTSMQVHAEAAAVMVDAIVEQVAPPPPAPEPVQAEVMPQPVRKLTYKPFAI